MSDWKKDKGELGVDLHFLPEYELESYLLGEQTLQALIEDLADEFCVDLPEAWRETMADHLAHLADDGKPSALVAEVLGLFAFRADDKARWARSGFASLQETNQVSATALRTFVEGVVFAADGEASQDEG